ncbi:hypothetical protein [Acanthopleuribacter pedis]|uniref:RHS repeat-associated core domain-containing protein n=1 Tax=Acanthopleuribacter pedis TaxID=442870 RepID=A0A8J7QCH1_9BACT|nr:hypothetical protein [Acanthopleuribacter pedis]MBO1321060.1 hypothetical protein [Acanthopleuribacter pedis]
MFSRLCRGPAFIALALLPLYAQTTGATAPEVTQFEPVDITDLVNLSSGDFQYALPVGDLPGAPGGSFPLSLNYKAGIRLAQEASWVGLGWNLQPGSISRAVRAYPDDYRAAPILTSEVTNSTYSYSVGIGFKGGNVGVNWDNHGGFGGQVGYSLGQSGVNAQLGFGRDGKGNTYGSWSASYSGSIGETGMGFSASVGSDGAGLSLSHADSGTSISSSGNVGIQGVTVHRPNTQYSPYITKQSGGSASLLGMNLGIFKSRAYRRSASHAYGYLHMDRVGREVSGAHTPRLNGTGKNTVIASEVGVLGIPAEIKAEKVLNHSDLDRTYTDATGNNISLDTFYQDFNAAYIAPYQEGEDRDALNQANALQANYLTGSFDLYSVAAPGLSGVAKPVYQKRGLLLPPENSTTSLPNTGFFQFHPYRNLMVALEEGRLANWPEVVRDYFHEDDWHHFETTSFAGKGPDNMVFLNDPALAEDHDPYNLRGTMSDQQIKRWRHYRRHHQSQRIRYHLDDQGRIERITVVKNDGIRYVFGVMRDNHGLVTAGAAPRNYEEERHSRTTESLDPAGPERKSVERMTQPYAYAWYLAAVTSPDFVDRHPHGHYGPEDFGDYITFQYGLANPSFNWLNPFPSTGEPGDGEADFNFNGRDRTEGYFSFERSRGSKDLYVPLFAKTRTHLAAFDYSANRTDNRGATWDKNATPPQAIERPYYRFRPGHYQMLDSSLSDEAGNPHPLISQIENWASSRVTLSEGHLVLFRPGTAHLIGLTESGQSMPVTLSDGRQPGMIYLGTLPYTHGDLFYVYSCAVFDGNPCNFNSITADVSATRPGQLNGSVKLDRIRIYGRSTKNNALFTTAYGQTLDLQTFNQYQETVLGEEYLRKTDFTYTYELGHLVPNSANGGRLSLTQVQFSGVGSTSNPFKFGYYIDKTAATHPTGYQGAYYQKDPWGFPSPESSRFRSLVSPRTFMDGDVTVPIQANFSLKSIQTPVGTEISLQYESDRYSRAQDRLAVNARVSPSDPVGVLQQNAGGMIHWQADIETLVGTRLNPKSFREVRDALSGIPLDWSRATGAYPGQVIVFARGMSIPEDCTWIDASGTCRPPTAEYPSPNIHRFVVPLDVPASPTMAAAHNSLDELARWLVTETAHPDGRVMGLAVWAIPEQNGQPIPYQAGLSQNPDLSVGEFGGGLRVSQMKTAPLAWPGNATEPPADQVRLLRYSYTSAADGLDSGTIFSDPSAFRYGIGGDQRLIVSNAHPYYNMPGSEIVYGEVTVSTHNNAGQPLGGSTRYRFITASEQQVIKPFNHADPTNGHYSNYQERIDEHQIGTTFWWRDPSITERTRYENTEVTAGVALSHAVNPMFRWKLRRNSEGNLDVSNPFEIAGHNYESPVGFLLRYSADALVINNSSLIGKLQEQTTLDAEGRPVQETLYEFRPSFTLDGNGPTVARFTRGSDGRLAATTPQAAFDSNASNLNGYQPLTEPFSKRLSQGVHTEKSQALVIARADGDGYFYNVGIRAQDEVWNQFVQYRTTVRHHEPLGNRTKVVRARKEMLAYDYSSGNPMLVETTSVNGDGSPMYRYEWMIPAHEVWDTNGSLDGMKSTNMLNQKGYVLTAESRVRLHDQFDAGWTTRLAGNDVQVLGANVGHWRNNGYPNRAAAWFKDANLSFFHTNTDNSSNGWAVIPDQRQAGFIKDTQYLYDGSGAPDGRWEISGQNTVWNSHGQVLEYRDRLGNFNSAVYDSSGTFLKASFTHARRDEVYYEDFEHWADNPTNTYPPKSQIPSGLSLTGWTTEQDDMSNLNHRMSRSYTGRYGARGSLNISFIPGEGRPADQPPPTAQTYWLRLYAKPGTGHGQHHLVINGLTIPLVNSQPRAEQDTFSVSRVDFGWYMIKIKIPTASLANLNIATGATNCTIDNIAIYPGATTGKARSSVAHYDYHSATRQITAMTDARGRTARFQYNKQGQLVRVIDLEGNPSKEHHRLEYTPLGTTP